MIWLAGVVLAASCLYGVSAMAEEPRPRTVNVSGMAEVSAEPDIARVTLGVESRKPTMEAARAEVAADGGPRARAGARAEDRSEARQRDSRPGPAGVPLERERSRASAPWLHGQPPGRGRAQGSRQAGRAPGTGRGRRREPGRRSDARLEPSQGSRARGDDEGGRGCAAERRGAGARCRREARRRAQRSPPRAARRRCRCIARQ